MNKIIEDQLKAVTSTVIEFDKNTTRVIIPKTIKVLNSALKVGSVYDIELADSVLHPSANSTLASNWNNGIVPKYKQYTVEVLANMAKMIKVNGVAIEDNYNSFFGWLPYDGFTVLKKY